MKKLSLATRILVGMAAGIVTGLVLSRLTGGDGSGHFLGSSLLHLGGSLFLNMFRMMVVPIVLISMILGVSTIQTPSMLGRVGAKTLLIFAGTTAVSAALGIAAARFLQLGAGGAIRLAQTAGTAGEQAATAAPSLAESLGRLIPTNVFTSMVEENMLQVIFVAVIIGLSLGMVAERVPHVLEYIKEADIINIKIIELTMAVAPFGVFCLMAETFASFGAKALKPLSAYLGCTVGTMAAVTFLLYPLLLWCCAGLSPWRFFRKFKSVMLFAFSSSSSNATLPLNISTTTRQLGVDDGLSTFILSLGATINMNGTAIMQGCATIFIANLYNVSLTLPQLCQVVLVCLVSSVGTAGMPGAGILMLGLVLQSVGIPMEGTAIILGIDRIVDMFRTTVNITGDSVTAAIVAASEKKLDRETYNA